MRLLEQKLFTRTKHISSKLLTLTVGAAYVHPAVASIRKSFDRKLQRPFFPGRVALVAHVFYLDLIDEVLACYATLPADADLIVTVPTERLEAARRELNKVSGARVIGIVNRGRDIAPFLGLLSDGTLSAYDAVLKIHTKRSTHLWDGDIRRRLLFSKLAGSNNCSAKALSLLEDPATAMVGWRPSWRNNHHFWMTNFRQVDSLCSLMGVETPYAPAFFEGSMFWVRPSSLARLQSLQLSMQQFEAETGQTDGALHHAIERAFCIAVAADGHVVRDIHGRLLYDQDRLRQSTSPSDKARPATQSRKQPA